MVILYSIIDLSLLSWSEHLLIHLGRSSVAVFPEAVLYPPSERKQTPDVNPDVMALQWLMPACI